MALKDFRWRNAFISIRSPRILMVALLGAHCFAYGPVCRIGAQEQEGPTKQGREELPETKVEAAPVVPLPSSEAERPPSEPIVVPAPLIGPELSEPETTNPSDSSGSGATPAEPLFPSAAPPSNAASPNNGSRGNTDSRRGAGGDSILSNSAFASAATDGYGASTSTTGSLLDVANIDLPATVNVVTAQTFSDQQVLNFIDVFRNVPGAVAVGDGNFPDRLFLRGMEVRARDIRKNGFLDPTLTPRDFANIERVEILKGPASVLYGSAAPSGTVNFITKKPVDASFATYDYQFGSFGLNRQQFDANSRVTDDGSLLLRFNGSYEDSGSFRDFGFTERFLLAPSARWVINRDTMVTWEGEIIENKRRGDLGIPSTVGGFPSTTGDPLGLPPNTFVGDPANDFSYAEDYRTSVVLDHRFSEDWALRVGASTVFYEFPSSQTGFLSAPPIPFPVPSRETIAIGDESSSSLIANLTGSFNGPLFKHQFVFGTEHVYFDSNSSFSQSLLLGGPPFPIFESTVPVFRQVRHGYYMQDLIEINRHWQVLAGVRFDEIDFQASRTVFGFPAPEIRQEFNQTTPRVGVVYQPLPDVLSLYFNYSRSFNPPAGQGLLFAAPGQALRAEIGQSFEAGGKSQLTDDLFLHVAGFHVTRENSPFLDTGAFPFPVFLQVGEERSQGAEVELVGRMSRSWSLISNYTYTDTRLTDVSTPLIFGQSQRNIPNNLASIWSRHDLVRHRDASLGVALGMVYVGDRSANLSGSVELPSYTRWDSGLYYQRGCWDSTLFVENLFDRHYAQGSINELRVFPGAPTTLRAMVGVRF